MKKERIQILGLFVFLFTIVAGCAEVGSPNSEFVQVENGRFILEGEPYSYVGTNFWYGAYLGQPNGDRERLTGELDFLVEHGVTNLRVLGASEESIFENSLSPAIINADGTYNEDLLIGLDYLLAEMGKRDMKAVIFLNNFWEWSGGMSIWNSWYGLGDPIDPAATGDWTGFMRFSARFYASEEANTDFRKYIETLITRVNTITGKSYTEDPSIMSWQLANEPRPGQGPESLINVPSFVQWIDATAGFIKSLAPNHLVSTGNEGVMGSLDSMSVFIEAHESDNIDYLTFHMWAKNWGWFDAQNAEATFPSTLENAKAYIDEHVETAQKMNKPIVMEEFGLGRDLESFERGSPVTYRDRYYQMVFEQVEQYEILAGTNFWSWGGFGEAQNEDYWWRPGDPFTGDPPQEPQGLNSVFADDESTLRIIKQHAENLKQSTN